MANDALHIPERFIRHVWQHQLFSVAHLSTPDGRPVEILSPGVPNHDGGPDFTGARIRINAITYRGDVELHRDASSWRTHSHHTDPHYNRVILHVVMTADPLLPPALTVSRRAIPLLVLHPFLDEKLQTAWEELLEGTGQVRPRAFPCSARVQELPAGAVQEWLTRLANERLELKIHRFEERLKELADERAAIVREPYPRYYGDPSEIPPPRREYTLRDFTSRRLWEQLLYEGIMECLGYSKNRKPFLALAQSATLDQLRRFSLDDRETMMAMLFGSAGLLPSSRGLQEKECRLYVRALRKRWRQIRPSFRREVLHEADWLFFRLRPGNFPTARLAAFCHLLPRLFCGEGFRGVVRIFSGPQSSARERLDELRRMFAFEADPFWQRHYHFRGVAGGRGITIGADRIHEIVVNAIAPIILLYARIFRERPVRSAVREMYRIIPSSPANSITRRLEQDVLQSPLRCSSALLQQGALHLYAMYCRQERCAECAIAQHLNR